MIVGHSALNALAWRHLYSGVSAFDYILPCCLACEKTKIEMIWNDVKLARNLIPFKGQVLNMISEWAFSQTKDIIPNALIENVDASVRLLHSFASECTGCGAEEDEEPQCGAHRERT